MGADLYYYKISENGDDVFDEQNMTAAVLKKFGRSKLVECFDYKAAFLTRGLNFYDYELYLEYYGDNAFVEFTHKASPNDPPNKIWFYFSEIPKVHEMYNYISVRCVWEDRVSYSSNFVTTDDTVTLNFDGGLIDLLNDRFGDACIMTADEFKHKISDLKIPQAAEWMQKLEDIIPDVVYISY